jgi:hypothetical protein
MSVSDVSICNRALQILGATAITSLTDNNGKARALNLAFEPVRRAELRRRRWGFAIKRTSLPALSSTPDSDYAHQYQLPNDCVRLVAGGDLTSAADSSDYRCPTAGLYVVEGKRILTNLPAPLAIRYLADITDAASFDSAFVEALAARLAVECCEAITESSQKLQDARLAYRLAIREAGMANAFEKSPEYMAEDSWVTSRLA